MPECGGTMEAGYVGATGAAVVVWTDRPLSRSKLTWKGKAERLTDRRFAASIPAQRCNRCQVGFFDYRDA